MSNSAWKEQIVVKGAGMPEGTYAVTLKDIVTEKKVVQNRSGLAGQSVITKEYDSLDADQKTLVDSIPDEFWPKKANDKEARKKAAFVDQVRFVFNDPATGNDLKFGAEFVIAQYGKEGDVLSSSNKTLVDFVTKATGAPIAAGDTFTLEDFFKPNEEFVLTLVKNGGFTEIDPDSVVKKELAKPIVKGAAALSDRAKTMLDWLKANMQGHAKREIVDLYGTGQFGTFQETTQAWQEIMRNVVYTKDGKTLDFSEAV